ncbi:OLC1v1004402C1 [Oldenlandia corymbosa var. corymbosa]|uniref:OLC1v1004402C1 n=1 Tax=Oldenlandia corymbosa var. corymbosa TaxID=529605 RepID=A0AAV1DEM3_OLDCO|nr:OLC1v1004402C1 [Oldenlandia corymbosa var. corymbosa]
MDCNIEPQKSINEIWFNSPGDHQNHQPSYNVVHAGEPNFENHTGQQQLSVNDYDHQSGQQNSPLERGNPAAGHNGLPAEKLHQTFSLASLELLNNYGKGFRNALGGITREEKLRKISSNNGGEGGGGGSGSSNIEGSKKLALGNIMKVAGEQFIQFSTQQVDGFSTSIHPYAPSVITSELSSSEMADVELVQFLLLAAECVGHKQYDLASSLINRCLWVASDSGNPTQRIVFYFAEALQWRIEIETGRTTIEDLNRRSSYARSLQLDFNVAFVACHQALPFIQATQFAAVQAVLDYLKSANKIHIIDLHIRSGVNWTVLMQALVDQETPPVIRITAVATATNKGNVEEAGKRLVEFARSMDLPGFCFNTVVVEDMKELKEDMFRREPEEAVAVYASMVFRTMLSRPDSLASVMKVMRRLKPAVVVVNEVEANHNSPSFVTRFTESLFFYTAFFDCLEDCMGRKDDDRKIIEGLYFGEGIRNMVATEGENRCTRNVTMEVWREYFGRFGLTEIEIGKDSIRQAKLILKRFGKTGAEEKCNLEENGKGIVIGWKGTPIHSLTTWKFV